LVLLHRSLPVRAARGESVSDVDTGAQWWNADNVNDPDIAILLYNQNKET